MDVLVRVRKLMYTLLKEHVISKQWSHSQKELHQETMRLKFLKLQFLFLKIVKGMFKESIDLGMVIARETQEKW